jgi:hypothetical protein
VDLVLLDERPDFPVCHRERDLVPAVVGIHFADFAFVRIGDSFLVQVHDDDVALVNRIEPFDVGFQEIGIAAELGGGRQRDDVGEMLGLEQRGSFDRIELYDEHRDDTGADCEGERGEGRTKLDPQADELHRGEESVERERGEIVPFDAAPGSLK